MDKNLSPDAGDMGLIPVLGSFHMPLGIEPESSALQLVSLPGELLGKP